MTRSNLQLINRENWLKIAFWCAFAASFLWLFWFYGFGNFLHIISVIPDDAAYYFKIAENFHDGKGFTFDGINQTNGFQPLWQYVLILIFTICHGSPETMYRLCSIVESFVLFGALFIFAGVLRKIFPPSVVVVSSLFFILYVICYSINGMESAILIILLSWIFLFGFHFTVSNTTISKLIFGVILGLIMLARLDMIFLGIIICAALLIGIIKLHSVARRKLVNMFWVIIGASVVVAPYLIYNYSAFGNFMPISGALKSSFPQIEIHDSLSRLGKHGAFGVLIAFGYVLWVLFSRESAAGTVSALHRYYRTSMLVGSCAILLQAVYIMLFMKWAVFEWHFAMSDTFIALAMCEPLAFFIDRGTNPPRKLLFWGFGLTFIIIAGITAYKRYSIPLEKNWGVAAYNAAVWARNNTGNHTVFGMKDAGNFGYFSGRFVVDMDGLVNNFEYQRALNEHQLREYLHKEHVAYIVQHAFWNQEDITSARYDTCTMDYSSHLLPEATNAITLRQADEVYRSPVYYDGQYRTVFLIWKLPE